MIKALIIDDEPLAHEIIKTYSAEVGDLDIVGQSYSAQEALDFLKSNTVDLLFLDIEMPVIRGLDFLSMLTVKPLVIITSAYEEYALESYHFDITDYLLKPYRFDRFQQAIEKVRTRLGVASTTEDNKMSDQVSTSLLIKVDSRHVHLQLDDIYHLEAYGNYVKVWQRERYLLTPSTLVRFEKQLPSSQFVRIHKSFIVQKAVIHFIEDDTLVCKNARRLPIGKTYRKGLLNG